MINEIAKRCNITKKAIQYYVEQGLLFPEILKNGYKDFSEADEKMLKKIVLYRQLNLSISEIKSIFNNPDAVNGILHQRTLELEKEKIKLEFLRRISIGEDIESLAKEINSLSSNTIIIKKSLKCSRVTTGDTLALILPDIELPEDLQKYMDEYMEKYFSEQGTEKINQILEGKNQAIQNIDEFAEKNKEILDAHYRFRQTEEYKRTPGYRMMMIMKEFCETTGYYDVFIPAMRRLSPLYNEYYEQMLVANERFVKKYPEYLEDSCEN